MTATDPVLVSIISRALKAITDEMSITMEKTARSPILCEAKDYVTGLYDEEGRMLEQTENLPILSFSLSPVCQMIKKKYEGNLFENDVIFHNDVFSLGNQNNDVAAFKPIFVDGVHVGFSATKGHQADIGGAVRGGYNPNATEVFEEAIRIPAVKVFEKGKIRKDVWDLIFANIRLKIVEEDMRAEIGACTIGERRLVSLIKKYGIESFRAHKEALFDATQKMMENEIRTIPEGTYQGEANVYYDGKNEGSVYTIRVTIIVKDSRVIFDFSKTDAQTNGFVNGTYTSSASAVVLTFLQMVNPNMPHNDGMIRPLTIDIPAGTILNAAYPKATTFGNHLCPPIADAIIRALSPVIPDRVSAGWNQLLCSLTTGPDPRRDEPYVDIGFIGLKGGSGALADVDGYDHIGMIDASGGVLDQDYEMFEHTTPHLLIKHEYWTDSAGPGKHRGGLGVETRFIIGSDETQVVTFGDGDVEGAFGLDGGKGSTLNSIELKYPDGRTEKLLSKDLIKNVPKGTEYIQFAGGGGGHGDPKLRDRKKLAEEVKGGIISKESAKQDYGM
ncbi:MAG: hydantoinase B/oxoprolinase family protein [Planctomycetes bacterium]|nr:hydantoinase B/oxoprolinase family protein [Planctomycetota bacterium]